MNNELPAKKEEEKKDEDRKYCAHCEQEIPTGKEIKVTEYLSYPSYWYTPRYYSRSPWVVRIWDGGSSYPASQSVYYLCPPCYKWYKKIQIRRKNQEKWNTVMPLLFIFIFVIFSILLTIIIIRN